MSSQQYSGRLVYQDLGPGAWILEEDSGDRWMLYFDDSADISTLSEGSLIRLDGWVSAKFSFAMSGRGGIEVHSFTVEDGR